MSHPALTPTVYHLISRFVAGEWFVKSDLERNTYLVLLGHALRTSDWKCLAFAIMSNHIHLCVMAGRSSRSGWLRNANAPFGAWINARNDRFGAVFANGMLTCPVASDDVAKVIAYIHNNPVRAGVVGSARDSTWTSHRAYLGTSAPQKWLRVDLGFALMRVDDPQTFDKFVEQEASRPRQLQRGRGRPSTKGKGRSERR
jgi:hypothetical protein